MNKNALLYYFGVAMVFVGCYIAGEPESGFIIAGICVLCHGGGKGLLDYLDGKNG